MTQQKAAPVWSWLLFTVLVGSFTASGFGAEVTITEDTPVAYLKAHFTNGQTFLTWRQDPKEGTTYRVYRSTRPIVTAGDLAQAETLREVDHLTSLNAFAFVVRVDNLDVARGAQYVPEKDHVYYWIPGRETPLNRQTGLFVYTAKKSESAYYAVIPVIDGEESALVYDRIGNSLTGVVQERVEPVTPHPQVEEGHFVHWTDNIGTEFYPAMNSVPSVPYNFTVDVPKGTGPFALITSLHGGHFQYNTPDAMRYGKIFGNEPADSAVRLSLDNSATAVVDIKGLGRYVTPDVALWPGPRVIWTMEWATKTYPVDADRWSVRGDSGGAMGSIALARAYPDKFAAIHAYVGKHSNALTPDWHWTRNAQEGGAGSPTQDTFRRGATGTATRPGAATQPASAPVPMMQAGNALGKFLAQPDVPQSVRDFFAARRSKKPVEMTDEVKQWIFETWGKRAADETLIPSPPSADKPVARMDFLEFIQTHGKDDFPFILMTAGRTDNAALFYDKAVFTKVAEQAKVGCIFYWNGRAHAPFEPSDLFPFKPVWDTPQGLPTQDITKFSRRQSFPAVADLTVNHDPGNVNLDLPPDLRPALDSEEIGDIVGTMNGAVDWERQTIVDTPERWEMTLKLLPFAPQRSASASVTPRRLQNFKTKAGETYEFEITNVLTGKSLAKAEVTADEHGFIQVKDVPIDQIGTRLAIWKRK